MTQIDKTSVQDGLKSLIEQTYLIEREYKNLTASYANLQGFIKDIVEILPNAIWVLDEAGEIFLQNSEALKLGQILKFIPQNEGEISAAGQIYLIKIAQKEGKKIISATDITTEKRTERLASMGQVAAHLAHEIRNPVGSISLLASTLIKKADERARPVVEQMQKAIWRVERIIKATLLFTKGLTINAREFNLAELKSECEAAIECYTYGKEIKFSLDFPDLPYVGDRDLLAMVFQNMLFNAIDDSGVPIKNQAMVFEPFKTSKLKGNGLGLHLCLQIVQAHGGSIEIELEPKSFCVNLPAKTRG